MQYRVSFTSGAKPVATILFPRLKAGVHFQITHTNGVLEWATRRKQIPWRE